LFIRLLVEIRITHNSYITNNIQVGFFNINLTMFAYFSFLIKVINMSAYHAYVVKDYVVYGLPNSISSNLVSII